MKVSVVIPTWRRAPWLQRCLDALAAQTRAPEEVIVVGRAVDTEAQDVVARAARRDPWPVRWVEVGEPGHVPPVRRGLEAARSEIVCFLDDDCEPARDFLSNIVRGLEDPGVGCVGGQSLSPLGNGGRPNYGRLRDAGRIRWYGRFVGHFRDLPVPAVDADGVLEGIWAWRTDLLRSLAFDRTFEAGDSLFYGLDLCFQAKRRGWRVLYVPAARAVHHEAPRDGVMPREDRAARCFIKGRNLTYVGLKHFGAARRAAFVLWWLGVGDRDSYGLAKGLWDLACRPGRTAPLLKASARGRLEGLRAWRRARSAPQASGHGR